MSSKGLIATLVFLPLIVMINRDGNSTAIAWNYFGPDDSGKDVEMRSDRIFCTLCLDKVEKNRGDQTVLNISKMANFSPQTYTGNLNVHLSTKHGIEVMPYDKVAKIVSYFRPCSKYTDTHDSGLSSVKVEPHEFNGHHAL